MYIKLFHMGVNTEKYIAKCMTLKIYYKIKEQIQPKQSELHLQNA